MALEAKPPSSTTSVAPPASNPPPPPGSGGGGTGQECAGCGKRIRDRYLLKALDLLWHEDCLKVSSFSFSPTFISELLASIILGWIWWCFTSFSL